MKRLNYLFVLFFLLSSCEDVIDIELPTETPRLIVDAVIRVNEDEAYIPVEVKVSLTNNFFEQPTVATLESIIMFYEILDEDGIVTGSGSSSLTELNPGSGVYVPDPSFTDDQRISTSILANDVRFSLLIRHDGKRYFSSTQYVRAVPIDSLRIGTETLFNEDETELIVTFTDDPEQNNFYIFDFGDGNFLGTDDQFYQGQTFEFSYFLEVNEPGQEIMVRILGADRNFYNYINLLISQSENTFGFFATPAATVRGNVVDITNLDNITNFDNVDQPNVFALGYFAVVQEFSQSITLDN